MRPSTRSRSSLKIPDTFADRHLRGPGWTPTITPYVAAEVEANLGGFPSSVTAAWRRLRTTLRVMPDVLTLDRPAVFGPPKDRPVLFATIAWSDVLLTLDTGDFGSLMTDGFYGLPVLTPGAFLERERRVGSAS